ncbi:OLC1v1019287C1 [Oldenlandia corymbosa var. corymbosa]|uniref:OLC1v1019287C1 n=1 Tax=Oldenlandia corymbosa var. corymbosa TaxID=529605 RepID=A0AAV1EDJ6_OLDCO|nr:OLC1v1019287C1 [Oldenlandia corymbosa var. corymbosa]
MDRISSLPDEILCHMLSFLPTKLGATTGVLSKRWRNVWGSVPVLCFEGLKEADFADLTAVDSDFGFAESEAASFNGFMDRLLRFRGDSRTQKFRLESEYLEPELLYKWMRSLRNVEELDLDIRSFGELNWRDIGFAAASIKTIKLSGDFNLNIPSDLSFPCLKILHLLYVIYEDDSAIEKLLYNCPVLEELKISRQLWDNVKNFVIYAPLVKGWIWSLKLWTWSFMMQIRRIRSKVVEELKLLKYILENAMVLEEMTILCEEGAPLGQPPMGIDNVRGRGRSSSGGHPVAANQFAETFAAIRDEVMNYGRGSAGCQVQILNQRSPIPVIDVSHRIV